MRAVVQRVSSASVIADGVRTGAIVRGLMVLLGIEDRDGQEDVDWLADKIAGLRIFSDEEGKMNLSLLDIQGEMLVVSQFTLHASTKKGKRPSFIKASSPDKAIPLYEAFLSKVEEICGKRPQCGVFGADMQVSLVNDGPVTIIIDTQNKE